MGQAKLFKRLRKAAGVKYVPQGVRKYASVGGKMVCAEKPRANYQDMKAAYFAQLRYRPGSYQ